MRVYPKPYYGWDSECEYLINQFRRAAEDTISAVVECRASSYHFRPDELEKLKKEIEAQAQRLFNRLCEEGSHIGADSEYSENRAA